MAERRLADLGRWRRGALLAALCGLVYYIGYDHGRASLRPSLEALESQSRGERERLTEEILRLRAQAAKNLAPVGEPAQAVRIALKANQSKTLFGGRLIVSVLAIDGEAGRAKVKVDLGTEALRLVEDMGAGDSLGFSLGGRDWSLAAVGLTFTTVNLNLMEINNEL